MRVADAVDGWLREAWPTLDERSRVAARRIRDLIIGSELAHQELSTITRSGIASLAADERQQQNVSKILRHAYNWSRKDDHSAAPERRSEPDQASATATARANPSKAGPSASSGAGEASIVTIRERMLTELSTFDDDVAVSLNDTGSIFIGMRDTPVVCRFITLEDAQVLVEIESPIRLDFVPPPDFFELVSMLQLEMSFGSLQVIVDGDSGEAMLVANTRMFADGLSTPHLRRAIRLVHEEAVRHMQLLAPVGELGGHGAYEQPVEASTPDVDDATRLAAVHSTLTAVTRMTEANQRCHETAVRAEKAFAMANMEVVDGIRQAEASRNTFRLHGERLDRELGELLVGLRAANHEARTEWQRLVSMLPAADNDAMAIVDWCMANGVATEISSSIIAYGPFCYADYGLTRHSFWAEAERVQSIVGADPH